MKYYLTGSTGGIGSAIMTKLKMLDCEFVEGEEEVIDWLIFAHGILDEERIQETFDVNTLDCIYKTLIRLPRIKQGVIYISSTAGITGNTKFPVYAASKAALNSYSQSMARLHPELQFYALCPGPTDTPMIKHLDIKKQKPEEVADVVIDIMGRIYKSGDIITVRDGVATV